MKPILADAPRMANRALREVRGRRLMVGGVFCLAFVTGAVFMIT